MTSTLGYFVFDLDRILLRLGPVKIHYYGVVFALTLLVGYALWRRQMRRGGHSMQVADGLLVWGVLAILLGARLAHLIFYDPQILLHEPQRILSVWEGGLASHGGLIGGLTALILYARYRKRPALEFIDRFAFSGAVGAAGIRLGNFLNSEIVGRPTDLRWAVLFKQAGEYADVPRHPSQLYEFAMGLAVLALLVWVDRRAGKEKRPLGLLSGVFLTAYFTGRFCVEFVKAPQRVDDYWALTMGQVLSIPGILAGAVLLAWVWRHPVATSSLPRPEHAETSPPPSAKPKRPRRRR